MQYQPRHRTQVRGGMGMGMVQKPYPPPPTPTPLGPLVCIGTAAIFAAALPFLSPPSTHHPSSYQTRITDSHLILPPLRATAAPEHIPRNAIQSP